MNCTEGDCFHCGEDSRGRVVFGCMKPINCSAGTEPQLDALQKTVTCVNCSLDRYQPYGQRSDDYSVCEQLKTTCDKERYLIECFKGNTTHDQTCRCNVTAKRVLLNFDRYAENDYCASKHNKRLKCVLERGLSSALQCHETDEERLINYRCARKCEGDKIRRNEYPFVCEKDKRISHPKPADHITNDHPHQEVTVPVEAGDKSKTNVDVAFAVIVFIIGVSIMAAFKSLWKSVGLKRNMQGHSQEDSANQMELNLLRRDETRSEDEVTTDETTSIIGRDDSDQDSTQAKVLMEPVDGASTDSDSESGQPQGAINDIDKIHNEQLDDPGQAISRSKRCNGKEGDFPNQNFAEDKGKQKIKDQQKVVDCAVSVGIIVCCGSVATGFRVGSKYIMTAFHVVEMICGKAIPTVQQGAEYFGFEALENAWIEFQYLEEHKNSLKKFYFEKHCLFFRRSIDIAILELKPNGSEMPPPFRKFGVARQGRQAFLIGHPNGMAKSSEPVICFKAKSAFVEECKEWSKARTGNPQDQSFEGMDDKKCILFNTSFTEGASGSPVVGIDVKGHVYVVCIFVRGYPKWFHDTEVPDSMKLDVDSKYLFKQGVEMEPVYQIMRNTDQELCKDIFGSSPPDEQDF